MAAPINASLPPFFEMSDGMKIIITALDQATGATVSGVTVANVSIDVDPEGTSTTAEPVPLGQIVLIPGTAEAA